MLSKNYGLFSVYRRIWKGLHTSDLMQWLSLVLLAAETKVSTFLDIGGRYGDDAGWDNASLPRVSLPSPSAVVDENGGPFGSLRKGNHALLYDCQFGESTWTTTFCFHDIGMLDVADALANDGLPLCH